MENDNNNDNENILLDKPLPLRSRITTCLLGIFVAVGGFLFGYDTGLINSISDIPMFIRNIAPDGIELTDIQTSIMVSFLSLGTFFGALVAPWVADKYGRRNIIIISTAIIFNVGNSIQVGAYNLAMLVVGRFISGVGIGLISAVVPLYQAEAAEKSLRGAIISTYQWAITIGLLVSNAVALGTKNRNDPSAYRIPIGIQYVWSCILAVGMYFLPESPRYFIIKDKLWEAANSLSFLRGISIDDPRLLEELIEIKATFDYESSYGPTSLRDCFVSNKVRPKQTLRIITGISIQAFQQFSGINFIFYYGNRFFTEANIKNSNVISLITYVVNVVFSIPGMIFVEYFGRRGVLICGGIVMTISNFVVASCGLRLTGDSYLYTVVTFICVFIASFAASWGGAVWVISAELFPLGVRSKCTAICVAVNWLSNFVCALITPYVFSSDRESSSTMHIGIFFIWGSINALSVVVVYFIVYETNGLRLEEITMLYTESKSCFDSTRVNKKLRNRPVLYSHAPTSLEKMISINLQQHEREKLQRDENSVMEYQEIIDPSQKPSTITVQHSLKQGQSGFGLHVSQESQSSIELDKFNRSSNSFNYNDMGKKELNITDIDNNILDIGNGLGLNTYIRGPPSILTESSDDESEYDKTQSTHDYGNNIVSPNFHDSTSYGTDSTYSRDSGNHNNDMFDLNQFLAQYSQDTSNKQPNSENVGSSDHTDSPHESSVNDIQSSNQNPSYDYNYYLQMQTQTQPMTSQFGTQENSGSAHCSIDWSQFLQRASIHTKDNKESNSKQNIDGTDSL